MSDNTKYEPTDQELREHASEGEWWTCEVCGGIVTTGKVDCYCGACYDAGQEIEPREKPAPSHPGPKAIDDA